ncbi:MAG: hypothetical protein J0I32_24160 [Sphingobacteriales bacterium]|nr:hypothetical protein [Sphingobacteriales bacterium]OJW01296.1 MAG: hypothetical protein BGO52_07635 [Sphingobacteriales bacterium 44-61]
MLFRKKKDKQNSHPVKEKAAKGIASFLLKTQSKFAAVMNNQTKNIPSKKMKILLLVFCLIGGGFSLYLTLEAILKPDREQPAFKIDPVSVPKHYDRSGDEELRSDHYIDNETYQQIQAFEQYMDSLQRTPTGVQTRDSILQARPGLMDSVRMLKEIYNYQ